MDVPAPRGQHRRAPAPYAGLRALVTGGAGFVGSWVCERLVEGGAHVQCVDDLSTGSAENVAHLADHPAFAFREADVVEEVPVDGPVDVVLHLASPASPVHYHRLWLETLRVGSEGTLRALEVAERHRARVVLASTSEVYGDPLEHPQGEDYLGNVDPTGPRAVYDEAKRYAEALTAGFRRHRGVDTAIARLFNTYGPRMDLDDGRVVPTFVGQALAGEPMTVAGDGSQTRSLCFVDDTVDALLRLATGTCAGPVNLGSEDEVPVARIAELVAAVTGTDVGTVRVPLPEGDPRQRRPRLDHARRCLGWAPTTPVEEGLRRTVAWMAPRLAARSLAV